MSGRVFITGGASGIGRAMAEAFAAAGHRVWIADPDETALATAPQNWQTSAIDCSDETALARIVCDYIAGMTDRFAIQCHARFIGGVEVPPGA